MPRTSGCGQLAGEGKGQLTPPGTRKLTNETQFDSTSAAELQCCSCRTQVLCFAEVAS